jgi:hypothetical protein
MFDRRRRRLGRDHDRQQPDEPGHEFFGSAPLSEPLGGIADAVDRNVAATARMKAGADVLIAPSRPNVDVLTACVDPPFPRVPSGVVRDDDEADRIAARGLQNWRRRSAFPEEGISPQQSSASPQDFQTPLIAASYGWSSR